MTAPEAEMIGSYRSERTRKRASAAAVEHAMKPRPSAPEELRHTCSSTPNSTHDNMSL